MTPHTSQTPVDQNPVDQNPSGRRPEHVVAVVEPKVGRQPALDIARDAVARGGRATIVLAMTRSVRASIHDLASSENLDRLIAEGLFVERLHRDYAEEVGGSAADADVDILISDERDGIGLAVAESARREATSLVVPRDLVGRAGLWRLTARSPVTVIVPTEAAAA